MALVSGPWPEKELRINFSGRSLRTRQPGIVGMDDAGGRAGRFCHIQAMIGRFVRKADRQLQKEQVTVTAPGELSVAQRKRVERCLNRSIGSRRRISGTAGMLL